MNLRKNHYKEAPPEFTIKVLKNKLKELNIVLVEDWLPKSTTGTYSVRVTVPGTTIGTNGKGMSKEFALASAYAEFFERLQNKVLGINNHNRFPTVGFFNVYDEVFWSLDQIVDNPTSFTSYLFTQLGLFDAASNVRKESFAKMFSTRVNKQNGKYAMYPFYNIERGMVEYIPVSIALPFYGSNGMSSGNSPAEALVQAFSEIFERFVQKKVIQDKLALPNVPIEEIQKYPELYRMYKEVNSLDGFTLQVKDCSLGGTYPVVAIVVIEKNTGDYGIHFGAHPNFEIALERAFTEASQGQDILRFAHNCRLDFSNSGVFESSNYYNIFDVARGKYPCEFFSDLPKYEYAKCTRFQGETNDEMLQSIVKLLSEDGYSILIRDVSIMDFPTFHVIIPGMSELTDFDMMDVKIYNTRVLVRDLLVHPEKICKANISYIECILEYYGKYYAYTSLASIFARKVVGGYPYEEERLDILYLLALCAAYKENVQDTLRYLQAMISSGKLQGEKKAYILALLLYYKGKKVKKADDDIFAVLLQLFDERIINSAKHFISYPEEQFQSYAQVDNGINKCCMDLSNQLDECEKRAGIEQIRLRTLFSDYCQ